MPCHDSRSDDDRELGAMVRRAIQVEQKRRLDAATKAACEMAALIRKCWVTERLSVETIKWIEEHERMDARRGR